MLIKRKIDLSSDLTEKIEKFLETISIKKLDGDEFTFEVQYEGDLLKFGIKTIDLVTYLCWFFKTSIEEHENITPEEGEVDYVK